jgi:predicted ATPase
MIEKVEFRNFKILRDAVLPLGPFTLIVGPNASGKSTALQAIDLAAAALDGKGSAINFTSLAISNSYSAALNGKLNSNQSVAGKAEHREPITVSIHWAPSWDAKVNWGTFPRSPKRRESPFQCEFRQGGTAISKDKLPVELFPVNFDCYQFDPRAIAQPTALQQDPRLARNGANLAIFLDSLRDVSPEHFAAMNRALNQWLPDYDAILFDTTADNQRSINLRIAGSAQKIPATDLSDGSLIALALLTLAYHPRPPKIVAFEEPDRGLHPWLLRKLQDALYRLSYPQEHGEDRPPVQVIATTHSPYFLDLYKDHPEEIVLAEKTGTRATFVRLSEKPDIQEILQDTSLGGAWYTGILGGVPVGS